MGLTIYYDLSAAVSQSETQALDQLRRLRERALALPFAAVSALVQLTESDLNEPWPMRGLAFPRLEDVVDVAARWGRSELYRLHTNQTDAELNRVIVPKDFPVVAIGFAVAPGPGSEPAAFGLATMRPPGKMAWAWQSFCKTQYASNHGEENFMRCHTALVSLLDAAKELGLQVDVRDDAGYWESRDTETLLARLVEMNRIVARIAGAFVDRARLDGADSRQIESAIFENPDFERLETEE